MSADVLPGLLGGDWGGGGAAGEGKGQQMEERRRRGELKRRSDCQQSTREVETVGGSEGRDELRTIICCHVSAVCLSFPHDLHKCRFLLRLAVEQCLIVV